MDNRSPPGGGQGAHQHPGQTPNTDANHRPGHSPDHNPGHGLPHAAPQSGHTPASDRPTLISLSQLGLPFGMLGAIASCFALGGWWLSDQFSALRRETAAVQALVVRNTSTITRLQQQMAGRSAHSWQRYDMRLWCAEAEKRNPSLKCPDPYRDIPNPHHPAPPSSPATPAPRP